MYCDDVNARFNVFAYTGLSVSLKNVKMTQRISAPKTRPFHVTTGSFDNSNFLIDINDALPLRFLMKGDLSELLRGRFKLDSLVKAPGQLR